MSTPAEPLFNIALRPIDRAIEKRLVSAAQPYADISDQYLLGPNALPHVTLCMFRAPDADIARKIFSGSPANRFINVFLEDLEQNPIKLDILCD